MKKIFFLSICLFISSCQKKQNVNLAKNLYEQSIIEAEDGNLKNALHIINKSIDMKPNLNSYALKATILYQLKEYHESLPIFQKIISDKKFSSTLKTDVMNNYACTLLALDKKHEAKEIWHQLVSDKNYLSPEVAWFNLGLLEFKEGLSNNLNKTNLEKSKQFFSNAVNISSEYADAYFYLALVLFYLNELESAKKVTLSLLGISPEHEAGKALLNKINLKAI
ncbi:MAG: hypothetical protein P4L22_05050 [Candidatus Babeliales bacterium]|nr:hypothetical protein [Candidatus Babeliales bacterium]